MHTIYILSLLYMGLSAFSDAVLSAMIVLEFKNWLAWR